MKYLYAIILPALALIAPTLTACSETPGRPLGATCSSDAQCESGLCVDGLCVDPGQETSPDADVGGGDVFDASDTNDTSQLGEAPETLDDPDIEVWSSDVSDVPDAPEPLVIPPVATITLQPPTLTNDDLARFEFGADLAGATFTFVLDGAAPEPCTSPLELIVDEGAHVLTLITTLDGLVDPAPPTVTWSVDLTAPVTTLIAAPDTLDNSVAYAVEFVADEPASFACRLDAGAWIACASPWAIDGLLDGPHTFVVRATDLADNVEDLPAQHLWTIDTTTPDTRLDGGPFGDVSSREATFELTSLVVGATFTCALDDAALAPCTSPVLLKDLADGEHTFTAVATTPAGVADPSPAVRTWRVDTVAPTVTLTTVLPAVTANATPTLEFETSADHPSVACRVDDGLLTPCASPYKSAKLADGEHTIEVRVTDAAGNTSSASSAFAVDTTGPSLGVTAGPIGPTAEPSPGFSFVAGPDAVTTVCSFDLALAEPCTSPHFAVRLADGPHAFRVRAADALGNTTTASRDFSVDTTPPTLSILSGPSGPTNDNPPSFAFAVGQGTTSTQCRVDTGAWVNCTSPRTTASLTQGAHTFTVKVADALANAATSSRVFTIDTVAPTVSITSGPANGSLLLNKTSVSFTFTTAGATTTQCRLYKTGQAVPGFASCTSPFTRAIDFAPYTFQVRVMDDAGNGATVTRTFTNANVG